MITVSIAYTEHQIYPIHHVKYDLSDVVNFVSDVGDLTQMKPDTIMKLTDRVSSSLLDVSNLGKTAHLSASTPSLVGPAAGMWSKLAKKKVKEANSRTHLLKSSDGLDNAGYVETERVSQG